MDAHTDKSNWRNDGLRVRPLVRRAFYKPKAPGGEGQRKQHNRPENASEVATEQSRDEVCRCFFFFEDDDSCNFTKVPPGGIMWLMLLLVLVR